MSTLSQFFPAGIKSIQRGSISVTTSGGGAISSNTATISAVNTAKSILLFGGVTPGTNVGASGDGRIELTNSTTVTAYVYSYGTSTTAVLEFQVVEYY